MFVGQFIWQYASCYYQTILNELYNNQFVPNGSLKGAVLCHSDTFFIIKKTGYYFKW